MPNNDTWRARLLVYFSLFFTGMGIGWLAGLSVSPVVSIVITSITGVVAAVIAAMSGVKETAKSTGDTEKYELFRTKSLADPRPIALLVAGIIVGSSIGVTARTHRWLAPDLSTEIVKWTNAGLSREEVARGLFHSQFSINSATSTGTSTTSPLSGVLFAMGTDECDSLRGRSGSDLRRELETSTKAGLQQLSEVVEDTDVLKKIVDNVLCAEQ